MNEQALRLMKKSLKAQAVKMSQTLSTHYNLIIEN